MFRFLLVLCLTLFMGPAVARAGEEQPNKPTATEQAAEAALRAFQLHDQDSLKILAAKTAPWPWLVADELCYLGHYDAAEAYAKAAPGRAVERLPAYVTSMRLKEPDQEGRQALKAMQAASKRKDHNAVLAADIDVGEEPDTATQILILVARGSALHRLGRAAESAQVYHLTGVAARKLGWLRGASTAFGKSGFRFHSAGNAVAAIDAWRSKLAVDEILGREGRQARTLNNIGIVELGLGRPTDALVTHRRSLAIKKRLGDKKGIAISLQSIGNVHEQTGAKEEALQAYGDSVAASDAAGDAAGAGKTLHNVGNLHNHLGQLEEARLACTRSRAYFESTGDRASVAREIGMLAGLEVRRGAYEEGILLRQKMLAISKELGDARLRAQAIHGLAMARMRLGDYGGALEDASTALAMFERLRDGGRYGEVLNLMGIVHERRGAYAEALGSYTQALQLAESLGDVEQATSVLGNIGNLHRRLGQRQEAVEKYERALQMFEGRNDKAHTAVALRNLGSIRHELGENEDGLALLQRALALSSQLGDRQGVAGVCIGIGDLQRHLGRMEEARLSFQRALDLSTAMRDKPGIAVGHYNLAAVLMDEGNDEAAMVALRRTLAVLDTTERPGQRVRTLSALAGLFARAENWAESLATSREAVNLIECLGAGLSDRQGSSLGELMADVFEIGVRVSMRARRTDDLGYFLESGRAGFLRAALGARESLQSVAVPPRLQQELRSARAAETRATHALQAISDNKALGPARAARRGLESAQDRVQTIVGRIQREARRGAAIAYPSPDGIEAIGARLAPQEALILYGLTAANAVALVIDARGARAVPLASSEVIAEAAEALDIRSADADSAAAIATLRKLLIEPLRLGEGVKRLLISPAGRLGYLPFALLALEYEIAYVPSGTTHGILLEERGLRGSGVLALGDPDYRVMARGQRIAATRGAARSKLVPLPETRAEVDRIADEKLLGRAATESGLRAALEKRKRWRAVHFACHGLVDPDRPLLSSLALTADGDDDGFLTCLDVFRMRIPADLVVLSACETGKGKIYRTEGIVGLTRAFMFAGAPRVLASLWKVDDEATQALMIKFYELWNPEANPEDPEQDGRADGKNGLGAAAALMQAQAFISDHPSHPEWKHPYYWAAWVLWGLPD